MADIIIECRELSRELPSPQGHFLLRDIDFSVQQGEVLAIVGRSGAGKSTLLRMINRLDEPTAGTVYFHGTDYRKLPAPALRRSIGMVMQRAYLFPGTIADNIAFGPRQHGQSIRVEEIDQLLAEVGLEGYASRDALTLSGGEAQRVAITRSLANQPEVLLLDEPTASLDEASRGGVERLLESLIRDRRLTCLWVTHNLEEARVMANRVLVLEAGRIKALGAPSEVLASYLSEFSAGPERTDA
jgi:putative ABC transport system ATP-binding protein